MKTFKALITLCILALVVTAAPVGAEESTLEIPDWINDGYLGVQLLFDENAYREMENTLKTLIKTKVPRILQPFLNEFACMEGAQSTLGTLCTGERLYLRFVLQK